MTQPAVPPGRWLEQLEPNSVVQAPSHLWGFGALHGGLAVAALTRALQDVGAERGLVRSITGRLHRPIRGPFTTTTTQARPGRVGAEATDHATGAALASTSLVTSRARAESFPVLTPRCPAAPPVERCEPFDVPVELVLISAFTQIRPVGPNRPYTGGTSAELTAWIRLTEDDRSPDLHRMIILLDALAPSYAAVLAELQAVPTVELTVRPSHRLGQATSPWVLLHAATLSASPDGWLSERIDAFDPTGLYLGSADQLRTTTTAS